MTISLRERAQKTTSLLAQSLREGTLGLTDIVFPARCAGCSTTVGTNGALCAECWQAMHFITDPMCVRCGLPFDIPLGQNVQCGKCMAEPPVFRQARSIFRYDDNSRPQIMALKYHDKTQLAPIFGRWLARGGRETLAPIDAILPVPLHYWRMLRRRYNQAMLLAYALARETAIPVLPESLLRVRATESQSGLTRRQREENMRRAFQVPHSRKETVAGKSLLLVDDVMTTGATLNACARALHDAGAADVYVLTLARTVIAN